jgi:hypothetical protein
MKPAGSTKMTAVWLLIPAVVAAAIGVTAMGQFSGPPAQMKATEGRPDAAAGQELDLFGGRFPIRAADYPVLGTQTKGEVTAVILTDFTRPWCLAFNRVLENAMTVSMPGTCIPLLPAATTPEAGEIQQIILTVFHEDPTLWRSLFDLINTRQVPATPDEVADLAQCLMGPAKFKAATLAHAEKIQIQLKLAASILAATGDDAVLPKLVRGSQTMTGADTDPKRFLAFLRSSTPAPQSRARPVLALDQDTVTLEAVEPGKPQNFQVKIQNRGDAPLQLGWTVLDEGCEVTDLPKAAISPGSEGTLRFRFKPPAEGGSFTRHLQIHSAGAGGSVTIKLQGNCAIPSVTASNDPAG